MTLVREVRATLRLASRSGGTTIPIRSGSNFGHDRVVKGDGTLVSILTAVGQVTHAGTSILVANRDNANGRLVTRTIRLGDSHDGGPFIGIGLKNVSRALFRDRVFNRGGNTFASTATSEMKHFRLTSGNAVFLSRVNSLSLDYRIGLLHILRRRAFRILNSDHPHGISVHIIDTAGTSLQRVIRRRAFHRSLFCHVGLVAIRLPTLHRHHRSVPLLIHRFTSGRYRSGNLPGIRFASRTVSCLDHLPCPNGVHRLGGLIRHALLIDKGRVLATSSFGSRCRRPVRRGVAAGLRNVALRRVRGRAVLRALRGCGGGVSRITVTLKVDQTTLCHHLRGCGVRIGS